MHNTTIKYFSNGCLILLGRPYVKHDFKNRSESRKYSFILEKSYNKTVIETWHISRSCDLNEYQI